MKSKRLFRIISLVLAIVPICLLLLFNVILKDSFDTFYFTNFILFAVMETINIVFVIIFFLSKDNIKKPLLILFLVYSIATFLVPVFRIEHTYSPTGPGSERMGLALDRKYRDIYGVDVTELEKLFSRYI